MLNHGVLALTPRIPGFRKQPVLSTPIAWALDACLLTPMLDEHFMLRPAFLRDGAHLRRRFRAVAAVSVLLGPFLAVFLLMHFALRHVERIYHHPSSLGAPRGRLRVSPCELRCTVACTSTVVGGCQCRMRPSAR
jgi:Autophagy protein ATG9